MENTLFEIAALILPLIFAIVFHEVAHGWMARALGDPTAEEQNRLSLNPIRHVDPVGTLLLPGALKLMGLPVFGWAKPVPVNKWRLRNPRYGMMAVAAAGPGSNLILAAIGAVLLGILIRIVGPSGEGSAVTAFLMANFANFVMINVFLAMFNLIPLPPFDGSHIVEGLLPRSLAEQYDRLRAFGLIILVMLLLVLPMIFEGFDPIGDYVMPPVAWIIDHYFSLTEAIAKG